MNIHLFVISKFFNCCRNNPDFNIERHKQYMYKFPDPYIVTCIQFNSNGVSENYKKKIILTDIPALNIRQFQIAFGSVCLQKIKMGI